MGKKWDADADDFKDTWSQTIDEYNRNYGDESKDRKREKKRLKYQKHNQQKQQMEQELEDKTQKNKHIKYTIGKIMAIIQGLLSIAVLGLLIILNMFPISYILIATAALLLLWLFAFFSQFLKKTHIVGKVETVLVSAILIVGSYYLLITNNLLGTITGIDYRVDNVAVVVLKDNPAQSLADAIDYSFEIHEVLGLDSVNSTISEIDESLGTNIKIVTSTSFDTMAEDLYSGKVDALIYNMAWESTLEEMHEGFAENVRILKNTEVVTEQTLSDDNISNKTITTEPFTVYISGNDEYGSIAATGRSDVNIMVSVNPETRQILMITTPRDSYLIFADNVTYGTEDKLTHAGTFGIDVQMSTMGDLYDIDIDYYARVNFTSLINIVEALNGVEVYSEYSFTAVDGKSFKKGYNALNGSAALMFSRERKAFVDGDFQRGKNQQAVLTAIIKKALSPAILTSYASLIGSLEGNLDTSMTQSDIASLVKMQLNDGSAWNIVSLGAEGTTGSEYCYSNGSYASIVMLDEDSIDNIKEHIQRLYDGEILETGTAIEE